MTSWVAGQLRSMKDTSRRFTEGIKLTIGGSTGPEMDPALEQRVQRFTRYNDSLDGLERSVHEYLEACRAQSHAAVALMHAFSTFFEVQMGDVGSDACPDTEDTRCLAQAALRLEEIHQSLRANIQEPAIDMQLQHVAKSIRDTRKRYAVIQKQLQHFKHKLSECDNARRGLEQHKRANTQEYERAQHKVATVEASLVTMSEGINKAFDHLDTRRGIDMKNELLTVAACQLYMSKQMTEHYEQLLPLLPGVARPLVQITEFAHQRPRVNPTSTEVIGVVPYEGAASRWRIHQPLEFHAECASIPDASNLPRLDQMTFNAIHAGEKLAVATYG